MSEGWGPWDCRGWGGVRARGWAFGAWAVQAPKKLPSLLADPGRRGRGSACQTMSLTGPCVHTSAVERWVASQLRRRQGECHALCRCETWPIWQACEDLGRVG